MFCFLFVNCCFLITADITERFFVGFQSDMVHNEPRRDTMFPEHGVVVGAMWVAGPRRTLLHVLHEQSPG